MSYARIRLGIFAIVSVIAYSPAYAKKVHFSHKQAVDPTCPLEQNGRPEVSCSQPGLETKKAKCPASLTEWDCGYYRQGYGAALEDRKVMNETERGQWKDDSGDSTPYKDGYEAGWRSKR